jgi:hypothetical protein
MKFREITIPYGKSHVNVSIPCSNLIWEKGPKSGSSDPNCIDRALENPVNSLKIQDLARGRNNALIIIDDKTRNSFAYNLWVTVLPYCAVIFQCLFQISQGSVSISASCIYHRIIHIFGKLFDSLMIYRAVRVQRKLSVIPYLVYFFILNAFNLISRNICSFLCISVFIG